MVVVKLGIQKQVVRTKLIPKPQMRKSLGTKIKPVTL